MDKISRIKCTSFHALILALLFASSFLFIFYEQAHFDSDQAISGLMAKHLSEGRHFPIFTYGAKYVLGFETWIAAPFMVFWGAQVWTLKLPLFFLNLTTSFLLVHLFQKETRLPYWPIFLSLICFVMPAPITASRMINTAVGIPTSLLACLLVWVFWKKEIALGILLGFVIPIRPFLLFSVGAMFILEKWEGTLFLKSNLKKWMKVGGISLLIMVIIKIWGQAGPNYKGPSVPGFVIKDPITFSKTLWWLLSENLATLYGLKPNHLIDFNVSSHLDSGHAFLYPVFIFSIFIFGIRMFLKNWGTIKATLLTHRYPAFLILTGVLNAFVYTAFTRNAENIMLIRYTVMCIYLPVGWVSLFYLTEKQKPWKHALSMIMMIWFAQNLWDYGRLSHEYKTNPPENSYRLLADFMAANDYHFAQANFWTSVHLTFFSQERVLTTENDFARIDEYTLQIEAHRAEAVRILDGACPNGMIGSAVSKWCVTSPPLK